MRLTRWVILAAIAATLGTAVLWPEGAERVGRGGLLAVGAALVADLVGSVRRTFPTAGPSPFAPRRRRVDAAWRPLGLTELQRDLRLITMPMAAGRPTMSRRLRETCRAAAQARLRPLGLDLDRPQDRDAAREVLGPGPYDFIVGAPLEAPDHATTAATAATAEELLAAVDPLRGPAAPRAEAGPA